MERQRLDEFRGRTRDTKKPERWDLDTERYMMRWLIARNWDVDRAEQMLRKSLVFRASFKSDSILEEYKPPEVLQRFFIGGLAGFAKDGCPVWIDPLTKLDCRGILQSATREQIKLHKVHCCETLLSLCRSQSEKLGKPVDQVVIIFDLEGLGWKHMWLPGIELLKDIICLIEDNYPEFLQRIYIINAPKLFVLIYNMVKSVISQRTAEKIHILGSHWKDVLLDAVPPDQLPVHYGGTQTDSKDDPRCRSKILYGGDIPKTYYISNEEAPVDMHSVNIPRSSYELVDFEINVNHCSLRYALKSEKHDVAYGILYKPLGSNVSKPDDMEAIKPIQRVNAHETMETGTVECKRPGIYTLMLDNTYSWTKSKTVYYSVEIVSTEGEKDSLSSALDVVNNDEPITDFI